ncbi:hypothetical protein B484DRAFT_473718, partial [Ochromonadaceae sp. CCMP2298]
VQNVAAFAVGKAAVRELTLAVALGALLVAGGGIGPDLTLLGSADLRCDLITIGLIVFFRLLVVVDLLHEFVQPRPLALLAALVARHDILGDLLHRLIHLVSELANGGLIRLVVRGSQSKVLGLVVEALVHYCPPRLRVRIGRKVRRVHNHEAEQDYPHAIGPGEIGSARGHLGACWCLEWRAMV